MAEKNDDEAEISWWDWAVSTKEKVVNQSTEVLGYVKKDINEFTKVISQEASAVVLSTTTVIKETLNLDENLGTSQMKQSLSGFFNHVAVAFNPPPDDSDVQAIIISNQQPIFLDRAEAATYQLYSDHSNFLKDSEGDEDAYEAWLLKFNIEDHQDKRSELLFSNEILKKTYTTLVPNQVSDVLFWHRFFYKVHKMEETQARREEMKVRVENSAAESQQTMWDEDEKFGGDSEISEHVQDKLLEEYEKERQNENDESGSITLPEINLLTCSGEKNFEELLKGEKSISPASSKDTDESWDKLSSFERDLQNTSSFESIKDQISTGGKGEEWSNWE